MSESPGPIQRNLAIEAHREIEGIEMGVLSDGTPYLSARGLARLCGVAPSTIIEWAPTWEWNSLKRRDQAVSKILMERGYFGDRLYIEVPGGSPAQVYPDIVCMAVLEYYAFEAGGRASRAALDRFRKLAQSSLREFVYTSVGYDPQKLVADGFSSLHQRLLLNTMPAGFYSVLTETAHMTIAAIKAGLPVDEHTVPDISVGRVWGPRWVREGYDDEFGARIKHPHQYPDDHPQSRADIEAWIYPVQSLGVFRAWLDSHYLPTKFGEYLKRKVRSKQLPVSTAELVLEAMVPKQLPEGDA